MTQERCFETTYVGLIICMPSNKINHPLKHIAKGVVITTRIGPGASMQLVYLFSASISLKLL